MKEIVIERIAVMPNMEEAIRERAYHLWIADGQPEGNADVYWLSAQREILTTSLEGSNKTAATRPSGFGIGHDQACQKGEGRQEKVKSRAA
jgi:hypothetical protein